MNRFFFLLPLLKKIRLLFSAPQYRKIISFVLLVLALFLPLLFSIKLWSSKDDLAFEGFVLFSLVQIVGLASLWIIWQLFYLFLPGLDSKLFGSNENLPEEDDDSPVFEGFSWVLKNKDQADFPFEAAFAAFLIALIILAYVCAGLSSFIAAFFPGYDRVVYSLFAFLPFMDGLPLGLMGGLSALIISVLLVLLISFLGNLLLRNLRKLSGF